MKRFNFVFTNTNTNTNYKTWAVAQNLQDAIHKIASTGVMPVGEEWRWTGVHLSK